jgi:hypothetical protein
MSVGAKVFLGLFVAAMLLSVAAVGVGAAAVANAGTVSVEVQSEESSGLSLGLPAILLNLGIVLAPDEWVAECTGEFEPVWPTLRAAARELDRAPDFVLLEISSADEYVRVEKLRDRLVVMVRSDEEQIRVALPLSTMRRIAARLDSMAVRG